MAAYRRGKSVVTDKNMKLEWHRVADVDELPEGRVKTVTARTHSVALTHIDGEYFAMSAFRYRRPHSGSARLLRNETLYKKMKRSGID